MKEDVITFDAHVFSIDTIKRALYRYSDKSSFDIQMKDDIITVIFKSITQDDLVTKINNEVLDQDLRDTLFKETANIRTLILANAFSNCNYSDPLAKGSFGTGEPARLRRITAAK